MKEMVEKEVMAYDVHGRTRSSEGMENLRVMQFAVTPQIARMDVVLYHANLPIRRRQVKLISYPEPRLFSYWEKIKKKRVQLDSNPYFTERMISQNMLHIRCGLVFWFPLRSDDWLSCPTTVAYPLGEEVTEGM